MRNIRASSRRLATCARRFGTPRLTASALGRTTSNGSIFVDADAVGALGSGQSSFGKPAKLS